MSKLLIVDDEKELAEGLKRSLARDQHLVELAFDGQPYDSQENFIQEFGPPGVSKLELQLDYFEDIANGICPSGIVSAMCLSAQFNGNEKAEAAHGDCFITGS